MSSAVKILNSPVETLADCLERLGNVPLERVHFRPYPGTATEKDVVAALASPNRRLCELVDGVLVEKAIGSREALLAAVIVQHMGAFVEKKDLGAVLGGDGTLRLWLGLVRIPDACFIPWDRIPNQVWPDEPIASLVPTLAVEVFSKHNTKKEIQRKLREYFQAGVQLVWVLYPKTKTGEVYASPDDVRHIGKSGALDGEDVLPGFRLPLRRIFSRLQRRPRK